MFSVHFSDQTKRTPTKIIGIGLNYADHITEMNSQKASSPVIFLKPVTALCDLHKPLKMLTGYGSIHHEIELAVCISKTCARIQEADALQYVAGYGMALDLTLREVQLSAKKAGHPWAIAKGFDNACPVSKFIPADRITNPQNLDLKLSVNSEIRHQGNTSQMIYTIPELVAYISQFFTLLEGDLILTGTPAGVGEIHPGDHINAELQEIATIETTVIAE